MIEISFLLGGSLLRSLVAFNTSLRASPLFAVFAGR
jgi:hypothetical protein